MMQHFPLALLLVLYFDGSFTPTSRSSPTSFASCGAVILSSDNDRYGGSQGGNVTDLCGDGSRCGRVIAVGGRVILPDGDGDDNNDHVSEVGGQTSAGAEYEGLLLGLRFVLDGLNDGTLSLSPEPSHLFWGGGEAWKDDDGQLDEAFDSTSSTKPPLETVAGISPELPSGEGVRRSLRMFDERHPPRLVIRGDCRTVVDQLNGSSIPRRLRRYHRLATELLDRIRQHAGSSVHDDCDDMDDAGPQLRIDVELVPRDLNSLADAVAREAGAVARRDSVRHIRDRIAPSYSPMEKGTGPHYLSEALDLISGSATAAVPLPINVRIALLREVAEAAGRVSDASALASAGAALRGEARVLPTTTTDGGKRRRGRTRLWSRHSHDVPTCTSTRAAVEAEGLHLEIVAMRMTGRMDEANRYESRYRYRLRRFHEKTNDVLLGRDGEEAGGPLDDSSQRNGDSCSDDDSGGHDCNFSRLFRSWSIEALAGMERLVSREGVFLVL